MSIPLTGTGGLFTRIGLLLGSLNAINNFRGTVLPPAIDDIQAQYATADQIVVDNIQTLLLQYQYAMGLMPSQLQTIAVNTILTMVNAAYPQFQASSLPAAMQALINQMLDDGDTVQSCTVGGSTTPGGSNIGNGIAVVSTKNANGFALEDLFAETVTGTCIRDAQSGGLTAGQEQFTFAGTFAVTDPLSSAYPLGSGAATSVTAISALVSGSGGRQNYLFNSDFELWTTPNIPNGWPIFNGTAGTTIKQSTAVHYDGASSLEFVGDGSELTSVFQTFSLTNGTSGTAATIGVTSQFAFNAYVRVSATPTDGTLRFALVDGSGTVINDNDGNPNSITQLLSNVSTTFVPVSGFFRMPSLLPAQVSLQIGLVIALDAGVSVYIDHAALAPPSQLYQGGPLFAVFSGNVNFILGDLFSCPVTNNYGGGFQYGFDKFFGMKQMGLLLPSSGSPTIPDALITT